MLTRQKHGPLMARMNGEFNFDGSSAEKPSASAEATQLQVVIEPEKAGEVLVVASTTMQVVIELEQTVAKIDTIKTPDGAQEASDLLNQATRTFKAVEAAREEVKRPFYQKGCDIDAVANKVKARLKAIQTTLKTQLDVYTAALETARKQEEARKQAEINRLLEEQQELQAKLQAAAAPPPAPAPVTTASATAVPSAAAPLSVVPRISAGASLAAQFAARRSGEITKEIKAIAKTESVPVKPSGIARMVTLDFTIEDVTLVPEFLLKPREVDPAKVRAQYCKGWKENDPIPSVPGLSFKSETNIKSGRG